MERSQAQFRRVARRTGAVVTLSFDGRPVSATAGDSVLAALLESGSLVRRLEFGAEPRAGFCQMGACPDCWVMTEAGERLRACTTPLLAGMRIVTTRGRAA